jgi:hypothetical protein
MLIHSELDGVLKINNIRDNSDPPLDSGVDYNVAVACFGTLWCTKSGSSPNVSGITLRPATGSGSISTVIVASSTEQ